VYVRLCDTEGHPLPSVAYSCEGPGVNCAGTTNAAGWAAVPEPSEAGMLHVSWLAPTGVNGAMQQASRDVRVDVTDSDEAHRLRLLNLGYLGAELTELLEEFRAEFGWDESVDHSWLKQQLTRWHDGGERPVSADASE
jgi:hypothetical protein